MTHRDGPAHLQKQMGLWCVPKKTPRRPGMMTTVSPDRHGYVSVQFGADGPFEMWHMEDLDLISEARFEMLRRGT